MSAKPDQLLFRFRAKDTVSGVSRETLMKLSDTLGYTETQVMHLALAKLAKEVIPAYEADEGDLTEKQLAAIRKAVPQGKPRSVKSSLF
jgi:predicted DNA binding protein